MKKNEKETILGVLDLYLFTYKIFVLLCQRYKGLKNENTTVEGVVAEMGSNHSLVTLSSWEARVNGRASKL